MRVNLHFKYLKKTVINFIQFCVELIDKFIFNINKNEWKHIRIENTFILTQIS